MAGFGKKTVTVECPKCGAKAKLTGVAGETEEQVRANASAFIVHKPNCPTQQPRQQPR